MSGDCKIAEPCEVDIQCYLATFVEFPGGYCAISRWQRVPFMVFGNYGELAEVLILGTPLESIKCVM
jgi:hypothetical protein